jgi:Tfp pilus assembly protein FimT
MLFVCAIVAIVAAVAIPVSFAGLDRSRGWSSARFLATRLVRARALAIGRAAAVAVRVEGDGAVTTLSSFADGNRNGVLTRDIDAGVDVRLDGPVPVAALFPGVTVQVDAGAPRLFSFSPDGTATTGSVYVTGRDGTRFAVRVLGATGRVRLERYLPLRNTWTEAF